MLSNAMRRVAAQAVRRPSSVTAVRAMSGATGSDGSGKTWAKNSASPCVLPPCCYAPPRLPCVRCWHAVWFVGAGAPLVPLEVPPVPCKPCQLRVRGAVTCWLTAPASSVLSCAPLPLTTTTVTGSAFDDPNVPQDEGIIGTFRDQATGIGRAQELIMDSYGMDLFDRDAVYADGDQGTFEEPICILSHTNFRIVGIAEPVRAPRPCLPAAPITCARAAAPGLSWWRE